MAKNVKEAPLIPAPFAFSATITDQIILNDIETENPEKLAEKLFSVVKSTDQNVAVYIIIQLFQKIPQSQENTKEKLIILMNNFILLIKNQHFFRNVVIKSLDHMKQFPEKVLQQLDYIANLHFLVNGCSSKYADESHDFIQKNVLPNIKAEDEEKISENVLFEICELNFEGFNPAAIFSNKQAKSPAFSVFIPPKIIPNRQENPEEQIKSNFDSVPIHTVLAEFNYTLIASKDSLCELFSFYPNFGPKDAAAFVLSLVLPQYHFMEFFDKLDVSHRTKLFEMHRDILQSRNITVQQIIEQFMYFDIVPLPKDSCCILFAFLACYSNNNKIDPMPFLKKWKSAKFQNSILLHFTLNNVPIVDFSTTPNQANIDQFLPSPTVFADSCNCWKSMDFIQCVIMLHGNNATDLEKFLESLILKYPAVVLTIFARPEIELTQNINKISTIALEKLIKDPTLKEAVNKLWKNSSNFISQLLLELYKTNPTIIDKIYERFTDHITELVESRDYCFATDIALIAATNGKLAIGTFIDNYIAKYGQEKVLNITHFISQKVSSMNSTQIKVTSDFFLHLYQCFSKFSINQQFFIQTAAVAARAEQKALDLPDFDLKVPQKTLQESKERAQHIFNQILQGKETTQNFLTKLADFKFSDPILHEEIYSLIIYEIPNIQNMKNPTIKDLGDISGNLVISHNLNKKQINDLLQLIKESLNSDDNSPSYKFGLSALQVIMPHIAQYPHFIYDLMRESKVRDNSPELFEKIQKAGQKISKPLPKSINIHPDLLRFKSLKPPSPRLAKSLTKLATEPISLQEVLKDKKTFTPQTYDLIALTVVDTIQDCPLTITYFCSVIPSDRDFMDIVFQAASFRALEHIMAPEFRTYEGCIRRRRLIILGKFIGKITLNHNRPILSRFLDLKKLLLYGISQGCLYGIVPFVTTILAVTSRFFMPPNPYISGLLHILAGINAMDSLKMYIKQHILGLLTSKGIRIKLFDNIPNFFPSKIDDNYDFLLKPFSLTHFLPPQDIDKMISFDDTILRNFVQQYIVIPDNFKASAKLKEQLKITIAKQAFTHIPNEGANLAKTASSTVLELIKKDFQNVSPPEVMYQPAYEMTKQLAASLSLYTAPMKISRSLHQNLHAVADKSKEEFDPEWIDDIVTKNYDWISQLLRDIVSLKAWKYVKEQLKRIIDDEKNKKSRSISILPPGLNTNSSSDLQYVYGDYIEIPLSQQPFPITEFSLAKEKQISPDTNFDDILKNFRKYIPEQQNTDLQPYEDAVQKLLSKCPNFISAPTDFVHFRSIIKSILKCSAKAQSIPFEVALCQVLEKIVTSVPPHLVEEIKGYVLSWVHTLLPSHVVCELVRLKLVDEKDLDKEFTALINSDPFNTKVLLHIMQTLYYGMRETSKLNPRKMISTLTIVCTIPPSQLDVSKEPTKQRYQQYLQNLTATFEKVYAPEDPIPTDTKLQKFCTFDPLENLSQGKAPNAVSRWRTAFHDANTTDLTEETREVIVQGSKAMAAIFYYENFDACKLFMNIFSKIPGCNLTVPDVLDSVKMILLGCSKVIAFDSSKYYYIIRYVLSLLQDVGNQAQDNSDRYAQIAILLHQLRPSEVPSFSFPWIQLISDKLFIAPVLASESRYISYFVLLADFFSAIGLISQSSDFIDSKEVFDTTYRSVLRLIIILIHDYRDFMSQAAPLLVQFLPFQFTQIRNMLLSLENRPNSVFYRASLQLQVSDHFVNLISKVFNLQQQQQTPTQQSKIMETLNNILSELVDQKSGHSNTYHFVQTILQNIRLSEGIEQYAVKVFISVMELCSSRLANSISNIIVDYIRDSSLLQEASKLAQILIHSFAQTKQGYTVSEMMMRVLVERLNASSRAPAQLIDFYNGVLGEEEKTNFLSKMPYIAKSPEIITFLFHKKQELHDQQAAY